MKLSNIASQLDRHINGKELTVDPLDLTRAMEQKAIQLQVEQHLDGIRGEVMEDVATLTYSGVSRLTPVEAEEIANYTDDQLLSDLYDIGSGEEIASKKILGEAMIRRAQMIRTRMGLEEEMLPPNEEGQAESVIGESTDIGGQELKLAA